MDIDGEIIKLRRRVANLESTVAKLTKPAETPKADENVSRETEGEKPSEA